jgi:hypothetical protein
VLLDCLTSLRRYISGDHKNLSIWDLEHVTRVVGRDGRTSNLECEAVWGQLTVDLVAMRHD